MIYDITNGSGSTFTSAMRKLELGLYSEVDKFKIKNICIFQACDASVICI